MANRTLCDGEYSMTQVAKLINLISESMSTQLYKTRSVQTLTIKDQIYFTCGMEYVDPEEYCFTFIDERERYKPLYNIDNILDAVSQLVYTDIITIYDIEKSLLEYSI